MRPNAIQGMGLFSNWSTLSRGLYVLDKRTRDSMFEKCIRDLRAEAGVFTNPFVPPCVPKRLYYGFVTGTTTLVGCLASGHTLAEERTWILFAMGFLAWGFNQIFSDWYDRTKDAINAPHRPMVTGALKPAPAFAASLVGLIRRP